MDFVLQTTQEEMMRKLAFIEDDQQVSTSTPNTSNSNIDMASPKPGRKSEKDVSGKRHHRWKNWGWKPSPVKSNSIEEETSPESPKKSQQSSRNSTPNNSPKHKSKGDSINIYGSNTNGAGPEDILSPFRRKKTSTPKSEKLKSELRSSAGARLFQLFDGIKDDPKDDEEDSEFKGYLKNGRPASIHILQSRKEDF